MSTDSRDQILSRVKAALAPLPHRAPLPEWETELLASRSAPANHDLTALFSERLTAVGGHACRGVPELVAFLRQGGFTRGYCDPTLWSEIAAHFGAEFSVTTQFDRAHIDDCQFGITAAVAAIAESGTLVLSDRATASRLGALAPWVHIAAVRREQILPDIPAALAAMPDDPNIVWVTGPSKTADVEGILIEGVHGPGVQIALLL